MCFLASSENNVMLTVFRHGELGNVDVSWTTTASTVPGFAPGSLVPVAGTLQFSSGENTTTFSLTVSDRSILLYNIRYTIIIIVHSWKD